jgi:hypothetical protein
MPAQPPETAFVHMAVDYSSAWLEGRSLVDRGAWQRLCPSPCDQIVSVDGLELRVTAPGMTTSNAFRIEPGTGAARLRVSGGAASARTAGLVTLIAGLPVALGGMALFGLGSLEESDGLKVGGIVTLSAGALAVLVSLPLLFQGSTTVQNEKGSSIARALPASRLPVVF